jgi:hypothetical protein
VGVKHLKYGSANKDILVESLVSCSAARLKKRCLSMPEYVTIKLYAETRKAIRLIAAETGEQMVQVMDRLCREELRKLGMSVATNVAEESTKNYGAHPE